MVAPDSRSASTPGLQNLEAADLRILAARVSLAGASLTWVFGVPVQAAHRKSPPRTKPAGPTPGPRAAPGSLGWVWALWEGSSRLRSTTDLTVSRGPSVGRCRMRLTCYNACNAEYKSEFLRIPFDLTSFPALWIGHRNELHARVLVVLPYRPGGLLPPGAIFPPQ